MSAITMMAEDFILLCLFFSAAMFLFVIAEILINSEGRP